MAITKANLLKSKRVHEEAIREAREEYSKDETNDLELCLHDKYHAIEPTYLEIMRRYARPPVKVFESKINSERTSSKTESSHWG